MKMAPGSGVTADLRLKVDATEICSDKKRRLRWLLLKDALCEGATISKLMDRVRTEYGPEEKGYRLKLHLDDSPFTLLSDEPMNILRDGDLVICKLARVKGRKRKVEEREEVETPVDSKEKKKKKKTKSVVEDKVISAKTNVSHPKPSAVQPSSSDSESGSERLQVKAGKQSSLETPKVKALSRSESSSDSESSSQEEITTTGNSKQNQGNGISESPTVTTPAIIEADEEKAVVSAENVSMPPKKRRKRKRKPRNRNKLANQSSVADDPVSDDDLGPGGHNVDTSKSIEQSPNLSLFQKSAPPPPTPPNVLHSAKNVHKRSSMTPLIGLGQSSSSVTCEQALLASGQQEQRHSTPTRSVMPPPSNGLEGLIKKALDTNCKGGPAIVSSRRSNGLAGKNVQKKLYHMDYECIRPIGVPEEGTFIEFRVMEILENYTPGLSKPRLGKVQSVDGQSVTVEVIGGQLKKREGRFELPSDEGDDVDGQSTMT